MPSHEQPQPMDQIMARCWSDASYKAKLLADPVTVLHAAGVSVPEGVQLRVLENTTQVMHLVIPARPAGLSDQMLDEVVGAGTAPSAPGTGRDVMKDHLAAIWMAKYFPHPKA